MYVKLENGQIFILSVNTTKALNEMIRKCNSVEIGITGIGISLKFNAAKLTQSYAQSTSFIERS